MISQRKVNTLILVPKKKKIWFMYFINGYSAQEISQMLPYDLRNLKRILKSMREELITYLPFQELKDNQIIEEKKDNGS